MSEATHVCTTRSCCVLDEVGVVLYGISMCPLLGMAGIGLHGPEGRTRGIATTNRFYCVDVARRMVAAVGATWRSPGVGILNAFRIGTRLRQVR